MKTLVFADVHLKVDAANRGTVDEFVAFLRDIAPSEFDRIVVVGDLFDFWFEYRHVVFSGYFDVLRALADLRDGGIECHLVCGNHDFWAGRFFRDELGFKVHPDAYDTRIGNRRVRFVHGDGVNPADKAYGRYKRLMRSWLGVKLMALIHPDWAMAIAQRVSRASRRLQSPHGALRSREIAAVREYARGVLAAGETDAVVCGHTHTSAYEEFDAPGGRGLYINTGGWVDERVYWIWDGETVSRYSGPLAERRRAPVSGADQRQDVALGAVDIARQKADQAQ